MWAALTHWTQTAEKEQDQRVSSHRHTTGQFMNGAHTKA